MRAARTGDRRQETFYVRDSAVGTGALTADCRFGRTEGQCVWGFGDSMFVTGQ